MTRLPDFLLIGAAKSGTSALFRYLKQHPQIYFSSKKEPHYFSFDEKSKHTAGPGDTIPLAVTDFDAYCALFENAPSGSMAGEASTSYLYREETPERIRNVLPLVKMVAILRNPIERAFSAYMHLVRDSRETEQSFRQALKREGERIVLNWDPIWHYTRVGLYAQQLARYLRLFSEDQILIFLHEDMVKDQSGVLRKIFGFLGVDANFQPDTNFKVNVSGVTRSSTAHRMIKSIFDSPNLLRWIARRIIPEPVRWKFTEGVRNRNLVREIISEEDRRYLTPVFRQDILALQNLLHRDLSQWLEG
jgi:hypothetical protein